MSKREPEPGDPVRVLVLPGMLIDGELIHIDYGKPLIVIKAVNGTYYNLRQWIEVHYYEPQEKEESPLKIVQ